MASETDQEIIHALRAAGVPAYIWGKTLLGEGQPDLSQWVGQGEYSDDCAGAMENTFFYPSTAKDAPYATAIANLCAKEMVLMGDDVRITSLVNIGKMQDKGLPEVMQEQIENALILIVHNFCEVGADFPLRPWVAARVRRFILDRLTKTDQSLILIGDTRPEDCSVWWPQNFLAEVEAACTVISLKTPTKKKGDK